jgi:hypothetical protein
MHPMRGCATVAAGSSHKFYWPALILFSMTVLLSAGILAAWRALDTAVASDTDFPTSEGPATESRLAPLMISNVSAEIGDMVFLNNVRLDVGPTPKLFVVTGSSGLQMLVASEANKSANQPFSEHVDIKGTIRRLPASGILRKEWMLSKEQIDRFKRQGVYIAAEFIRAQ